MTMLASSNRPLMPDDQLAGVAGEERLVQRAAASGMKPAMRIVALVGQRAQHVAGAVDANDVLFPAASRT